MAQGLGPNAPNAGGLGLILGQGTRSHMPQLRVFTPQLKNLMPKLTPDAAQKKKDSFCLVPKTTTLYYTRPSVKFL